MSLAYLTWYPNPGEFLREYRDNPTTFRIRRKEEKKYTSTLGDFTLLEGLALLDWLWKEHQPPFVLATVHGTPTGDFPISSGWYLTPLRWMLVN